MRVWLRGPLLSRSGSSSGTAILLNVARTQPLPSSSNMGTEKNKESKAVQLQHSHPRVPLSWGWLAQVPLCVARSSLTAVSVRSKRQRQKQPSHDDSKLDTTGTSSVSSNDGAYGMSDIADSLTALGGGGDARAVVQGPMSRARTRFDTLLALAEFPLVEGTAFVHNGLAILVPLVVDSLQLVHEVYRTYIHFRLRRFVRFALGVPFLFGTIFLFIMAKLYFPEPPKGLDTSSVAELGELSSVAELMRFTLRLRSKYNRMLAQHEKEQQQECDAESTIDGRGNTTWRRSAAASEKKDESKQWRERHMAANVTLTPEEKNGILRGLLLVLRSIETRLMGTAEERALIQPVDGLVTTPASAAGAATTAREQFRPICPAEFVLRVVLSIALEQGWFDIVEHAHSMFGELVRNSAVPLQASIVSAVGVLCALSYELENCTDGTVTLEQRARVAKAIDVFRPESAVQERCTLTSEIIVLPLPDSDNTTRCLSMIRHSPGRKPQLIMCFIGSNSKRNWITNFYYRTTPLPESFGVKGGARVHKGFLDLLQSIQFKDVAKDFDSIILMGHSLGGALAQLAGLELAAERPNRRITVVTVASPRVLAVDRLAYRNFTKRRAQERAEAEAEALATGRTEGPRKGAAAHQYDTLSDALRLPNNYRSFRGFIQSDAIPQLPPELLNYTHAGARIPLHTGCSTLGSFIAWGMWSGLFHNSDLYSRVLSNPLVAQTHRYNPSPAELALQASKAVESAGVRSPDDDLHVVMM